MPCREAVGNHILLRIAVLSPQLADSFAKATEESLLIRNFRHPACPWLLEAYRGGLAHIQRYGQSEVRVDAPGQVRVWVPQEDVQPGFSIRRCSGITQLEKAGCPGASTLSQPRTKARARAIREASPWLTVSSGFQEDRTWIEAIRATWMS